jgi:flagellar basal-body rod protein FlgB
VKLFESTAIPVLSRALDAYTMRHKAIASNLANITTPGYRTQTVRFEEELAGALQSSGLSGTTTHAGHLPIGGSPVAQTVFGVEQRALDGTAQGDPTASGVNNVDLDGEMAELAKNQLRFKFSARLIADTFRGIQKSIRGTP